MELMKENLIDFLPALKAVWHKFCVHSNLVEAVAILKELRGCPLRVLVTD